MRILYLVHQFFPNHYTGTERFTLNLAQQMSRMGHLPLVMTYERDAGEHEGFTPIHADVLMKRYSFETVPVISFMQTRTRTFYELTDSSIEEAFKRLHIKCDIVHICHPMWLSSVANACQEGGIPIVLTVTDPTLLCPRSLIDIGLRLCNGPMKGKKCIRRCHLENNIIQRYQEALNLFNMADEVTTSSEFTRSLFRRNGWTRRIRIVAHSVDYNYVRRPELTNQGSREVSFGYIGTISWHKGLHILVNAFRKVKSRNLRLNIYGSVNEDLQYGNEIVRVAKEDTRIEFRGSFDIVNSAEVMNNVSVLVVPSVYYDNYPLVTLMALAYKTPVIGSDIGGIPEVIQHGKNGFLFKPGNSDELASLIKRIAAKPELLKRLRENIVSPRRVEEEALDYENIYRKLTVQAARAADSRSHRAIL